MRKHLHRRLHSDFQPRSICSTGAEEAIAAEAALGELGINTAGMTAAEMTAGGVGASVSPFAFASLPQVNPYSLGLQAAGTLLKGSAAQDAADRKMRLAKALGTYKMANAKQQTGVVNQYIEGETPDARASALADATADAKLGFDQSVGAAQAFQHPSEVAGKVSQQFKDANAASADATAARNAKLIANLAAMRAPGLATATRGRQYGAAAGDISGLSSAANNVGNAYGVDMGNVQANPWAKPGGDILSGVGQGIGLNDASAKTIAAWTAAQKKALGGVKAPSQDDLDL